MRLRTIIVVTGCAGGLLVAGPALAGAQECTGVQYTTPSGTVICEPAPAAPAPVPAPVLPPPLVPALPDELARVLAPGAEGAVACSPGAVVTVLGTSYTCPPAAGVVPPPLRQEPIVISPPTARESTVPGDLVVTH